MNIRFVARGFTLIELMITIAIVAILTALALPSFQSFIRRNAVASEVNLLIGSLQTARTLALSGSFQAGVCRAALVAGVPECATAVGQYDTGHAIFTINPSKPPAVPGLVTEFRSYVEPSINRPVEMLASTPAQINVVFDRLGRIANTGVTGGVQFTACYKGTATAASSTAVVPGVSIFVARSGRITSVPIAAAQPCVPNDARASY